jgi:hypothetical protein
VGKRNGWKRCDYGYTLIYEGVTIGRICRTSDRMWFWENCISAGSGYEHRLRDAKVALLAALTFRTAYALAALMERYGGQA